MATLTRILRQISPIESLHLHYGSLLLYLFFGHEEKEEDDGADFSTCLDSTYAVSNSHVEYRTFRINKVVYEPTTAIYAGLP
ncbi:MAG TPA: hypothetical protein DDW33_11030 [Ktedonobacter sp.]|jgi:hypothetical protein|nr:hypothetical protein [Ktedonobacter sp.]HCJ33443.1 hypothetical protein [Ktedonobacter sp.]